MRDRPEEYLSEHAEFLKRFGPETATAVQRLATALEQHRLYMPHSHEIFRELHEALEEGWRDAAAAPVLDAVARRITEGGRPDIRDVARWIRAHKGDPQSVVDCMALNPPEEIAVQRLLSRAGSQKVVFLGNWRSAQREVVLKRFIGADSAKKIMPREMRPHPLSMAHENIIETHKLTNDEGEEFLVERRLPHVLDDQWPAKGIHEAANLLRDIASGLAFLQTKGLIHGDIKPDNIGCEDGRYILLDFGICRPEGAFTEDVTPTGSLRTRAPELLLNEAHHSHKSDIWALGATVFNAVCGRFPLFEVREVPPRVSKPEERQSFEDSLRRRVDVEWGRRVDVSSVPVPLHDVLARMLSRRPEERPSASELVQIAEEELAAFLRAHRDHDSFSPTEEIGALARFLPDRETLALMPENEMRRLRVRVEELGRAKGLEEGPRRQAQELLERLT